MLGSLYKPSYKLICEKSVDIFMNLQPHRHPHPHPHPQLQQTEHTHTSYTLHTQYIDSGKYQ